MLPIVVKYILFNTKKKIICFLGRFLLPEFIVYYHLDMTIVRIRKVFWKGIINLTVVYSDFAYN